MNRIELKSPVAYDEDFALWSAEQAALIRAGKFDGVDLENVAEGVESLGRSDRRHIESRLTVILIHLLKWQFQPAERTNSWAASVVAARDAIAALTEDSPSLRGFPQTVLHRAYRPAPLAASGETHLPFSIFPEACPYSIEQVLDPDSWPGGAPQ